MTNKKYSAIIMLIKQIGIIGYILWLKMRCYKGDRNMMIFQCDTLVQICTHAKSEYPDECCGIILGKRADKLRTACRIVQTPNMTSENNSSTHFLINPLDVARIEMLAEDDGLEVVGFYHSHPDCEAEASEEDILYMIEGYSYPIISVKGGMCVGMNSFEKRVQTDAGVNKEEILVKEKGYAGFGIHISDTEELC